MPDAVQIVANAKAEWAARVSVCRHLLRPLAEPAARRQLAEAVEALVTSANADAYRVTAAAVPGNPARTLFRIAEQANVARLRRLWHILDVLERLDGSTLDEISDKDAVEFVEALHVL